jgi:BexC/CtrB/KpsE family polysaccharide export inner-membrane protein
VKQSTIAPDEQANESKVDLLDAQLGSVSEVRPFFVRPLFLGMVVLPTLVAALYFGVFASDVYISDSRFVIRSPARQANSPLGVILNAGGFAGAGEESSAVQEYVRSRDALNQADADRLLTKAFSDPTISWFDRFGTILRGQSREHFFDYYLGKVSIENDSALQVTRLEVKAYTPKDAREINQRLLRQAESLVNRLAERARDDAITVAATEVRNAQANARTAALALSRFRGREGILDPAQEAGVRLQMVSKLQDQLVAARTQLQQLLSLTPQASQIPFLRSRIGSLEREIAEQTGSIAGGRTSLSSSVVKYQELRLDSDLAEKQLAAAIGALEEARAEARRKRAYVERISEPSLPDYPREPKRIRGIFATLLLSLLAWGVLSALVAGVREHQD